MRRIASILLTFMVTLSLASLLSTEAKAGSIAKLSAQASGNKISVTGEVQSGVLAIAVLVYDQSGKELLCMETAGVEADNSYHYTLTREFSNGPYLVKTADYDGGPYLEQAVTVSSQKAQATSPKTGDHTGFVAFGFAALMMALAGIVVWKKYLMN